MSPTQVTKFEMVKMISDTFNLDIEVNPVDSDYLVDRTLSSNFESNYVIKELKEQIEEMKSFSKNLYE
jgi:hypothetical protein